MLTKRLIACFDVIAGRVTKARSFQHNIDVDDAESMGAHLYEAGIDEIIFYDIMASVERRQVDIQTITKVAKRVFVPFTVGGGVKDLDDMYAVLKAGAEKISVDSMAVRHPEIISEGARALGRQCMVLSMQVKRVVKTKSIPSGYEIAIDGARVYTGMDALEWARRGVDLGAGEICVNSIDQDGTQGGYDLEITRAISEAVDVPVIASGGAGTIDHIFDAVTFGGASAAIISSLLYSPRVNAKMSVRSIKEALHAKGVHVRPHSSSNDPVNVEDTAGFV